MLLRHWFLQSNPKDTLSSSICLLIPKGFWEGEKTSQKHIMSAMLFATSEVPG